MCLVNNGETNIEEGANCIVNVGEEMLAGPESDLTCGNLCSRLEACRSQTMVGSTVYLQRQKSHALALDTGRISGSKQSTHLLRSHLHLSCHDLILHSNLLYLPDCSKPLMLSLPCTSTLF